MVKPPSRHEVRRRVASHRSRRAGSTFWGVLIAVIVILGVGSIALLRASSTSSAGVGPKAEVIVNGQPQGVGDHWHAVFGVYVCGQWVPAADEFEAREGIHTHGDNRIHIHPYDQSAAGKNATVGRYFELGSENSAQNPGNWKLTEDEVVLWDGQSKKNGDTCTDADGKERKGTWRWALGRISDEGEVPDELDVQSGNLADYRMRDGDIITLAFLPEDEKIPLPPAAETVNDPSEGGTSLPIDPSALTTLPVDPSATTTPAPESTAPPASTP